MTLVSSSIAAGNLTGAVASAGGLQGRVLWCDAEANIWALSSRDKVAELADQCKAANINVIVVDVKPFTGIALYNSHIAPKLKNWQGKPYPQDYDLLQTMIEEGHRVGIEVHAAINVFSEGAANRDECGASAAHPEWQCIRYDVERSAHGTGPNTFPIIYADKAPGYGKLAIIGNPKNMPKTMSNDVVRVAVDSAGYVTTVSTGCSAQKPFVFPPGGYILLGNGPAGDWLNANAALGTKMEVDGQPKLSQVGKSGDQDFAVFVNPGNPDVRAYELSIISEIVKDYDVDGIVFDRMRYPGMYADFSDQSRTEFEAWMGQKVENFPEDIFTINPIPGHDLIRGKFFAKWMEWRAQQIKSFLADARQIVKSAKPNALVGAYVGSWYNSYYDVGVNWASARHQPPYDFAEPSYKETGYAGLVDWMCTGCYYECATKEEAHARNVPDWASVEAGGEQSINAVEDDTFVYGSLYLLQYARDPAAFQRAIAAAEATTQGVMLFDLVYVRDYNWWDILKKAFPTPAKAPHAIPGLINKVKEVRQLIENNGKVQCSG